MGTGDCSPTGSEDRFGTETNANTSTKSNGVVTTRLETSIHTIIPVSVASGTVVITSTNANGSVTNFTTTSIYPIIQ